MKCHKKAVALSRIRIAGAACGYVGCCLTTLACGVESETSPLPAAEITIQALSTELARGQTVDASSVAGGFTENFAVDGAFGPGGTSWSSVFETGAWIQVDLGGPKYLRRVDLWNRADGCCGERLRDFFIQYSLDGTLWKDSGLGLITVAPSVATPSSYALLEPIGRYVRLAFSTPDYHHVGEIQVYGEASPWPAARQPTGVELSTPTALASRGGSIVVSSTAGGFSSTNLNDNNLATSWSSYTQGYGTVTVDLGQIFGLDSVQLSNRGDGCCASRLRDFYIDVSTNGSTWADSGLGMIRVAPSHRTLTTYPVVALARYVRIRDDTANNYFHIGELKVFGFAI